MHTCSNRGSDQPNLSQEAKELLKPLAHSYLLHYLDKKLSLDISVLQCGHSHNVLQNPHAQKEKDGNFIKSKKREKAPEL